MGTTGLVYTHETVSLPPDRCTHYPLFLEVPPGPLRVTSEPAHTQSHCDETDLCRGYLGTLRRNDQGWRWKRRKPPSTPPPGGVRT